MVTATPAMMIQIETKNEKRNCFEFLFIGVFIQSPLNNTYGHKPIRFRDPGSNLCTHSLNFAIQYQSIPPLHFHLRGKKQTIK
ncbi:hypothetical protein A9239_10345 [Methanosarcina sp. A14]|nr:hypothetical protein A9239_10345 [Methanosarcina sp. A14]